MTGRPIEENPVWTSSENGRKDVSTVRKEKLNTKKYYDPSLDRPPIDMMS